VIRLNNVNSQQRLAIVGILIEDRDSVSRVNSILSDFSEIIVGRMGIPYKERGVSMIALIIDGTTDQLGALTGRLGNLRGVKAKAAVTT